MNDSGEIKYLYIRSAFSTRKDRISQFRELFAAKRYMPAKSKNELISMSDTLKRLTETRKDAIYRIESNFKQNRAEKIISLLGTVEPDNWKRRTWEHRQPKTKPRAEPRPGSSKGKIIVIVKGASEVLRNLLRLERALHKLSLANHQLINELKQIIRIKSQKIRQSIK